MSSPKPVKSDKEFMSNKNSRNASLRAEKQHESTRNSQILKMSSLFGSKTDMSGQNVASDHVDKFDERNKLVNDYYQKAEQANKQIHRPKVGG